MPFTAGEVILAARDLNPAFTPTRHPDPVCLRFLSRYQRTLAARIVAVRPRALTSTITTVTLPLADFAVGVPVPADLLLLDVRARPLNRADDTVRHPVELIPGGQSLAGHTAHPFAWRDGNTLFLGGRATNWTRWDRLELRTVAMPAALAGVSTTLPWPDDALDVFTAQLAAFLARRHAEGPETTKFNANPLQADAAAAEADFVNRLTTQRRAETWTMRRLRD